MIELQNAIKKLIKSSLPAGSVAGTVVSVDGYTCEVKPADEGANYHGVRVKPTIDSSTAGIITIPKINSFVIISPIDGDENKMYISSFSELQSIIIATDSGSKIELKDDGTIVMNDGTLGGLIKIQPFLQELNKTNTIVAALIGIINGTVILEPGNGSPSALQIALKSAITGQVTGDFTNVVNDKVTHG